MPLVIVILDIFVCPSFLGYQSQTRFFVELIRQDWDEPELEVD